MMDGNTITDDNSDMGGEIEIERIPTRTIEARSKELMPVFDCLQSSRFGHSRFILTLQIFAYYFL